MRLHPIHPKITPGLNEFALLLALLGSAMVLVLLVTLFTTSAH